MGDIIEFTTWRNSQLSFYKVTSSGMWFDLKATGCAIVALTETIEPTPDYVDCKVGIELDRVGIKMGRNPEKSILRPGLINSQVYTRFWLTWHGGVIKLGLYGNKEEMLKCKMTVSNLNYVTFTVLSIRSTAHWRFELPPPVKKPKMRPIPSGKLEWVEATNQLPDGAFIAGHEDESLYIIRAPHNGSLTSGKFVPSKGVGLLSWGGREHEKNDFEVLCGYDCYWVPASKDRIPIGAVPGGYSERPHEILFVGRAVHDGHVIPGKVQPSHKVCYVPYNDRECASQDYEVLVSTSLNAMCANEYWISNSIIHNEQNSDDEDSD